MARPGIRSSRSEASTAERAKERAEAAEKAAEQMREEMRRSVGVERQRVAGMLYKEALNTHTLEEQARGTRPYAYVYA